jgi:L-lactate dehydrogenase (cytochrome)
VLIVDTPRSPKKEWNDKNGFGVPVKASVAGAIDVLAHPRWSIAVLLKYLANSSPGQATPSDRVRNMMRTIH